MFGNLYSLLVRAVTSPMGGTIKCSSFLGMEDGREYPIATIACRELTCYKLETSPKAIVSFIYHSACGPDNGNDDDDDNGDDDEVNDDEAKGLRRCEGIPDPTHFGSMCQCKCCFLSSYPTEMAPRYIYCCLLLSH